ncbi:MAG: PfkB family carbohydrate kinase [Patescibacteria group bacterium]
MAKKAPNNKAFSEKKILVIGDLIVDLYHYGNSGGRSHESGNSVGIHKRSALTWGGAGLVVRNMLELGARVTFFSVLGDDEYSKKAAQFSHPNLRKKFLVQKGREIITKERFVVDDLKVFRWNRGSTDSISATTRAALKQAIARELSKHKAVLIADYRAGLLSKELATYITKMARAKKLPVYVDSQVVRTEPNFDWYRKTDLVCLNETEAKAAFAEFSCDAVRETLPLLAESLAIQSVIVKLGAFGSAALIRGEYLETPAHSVDAIDPVGAGDAFLAALAMGQFPPTAEDLLFANRWAALATTTMGTEPPKFSQLKKLI